jgi:Holliday junction resolvase
MKHYNYGIRKEREVAQLLRRRGASVTRSPASRGSSDLTATFATRTKWCVQVKSCRKGMPASPSRKDLGRLKQSSTKRGATAVVAKVSPRGVAFISARTAQLLKPPSGRRS